MEDWTPYNGEKKEPELVFSNRRWFPADYGPRFWSDFDLDNKMVPGTPAISYYDCDSHPYEKTDLGDGSYRIDVGFLGYEWSGILRPGEDCILSAGDYDEFRLIHRYLRSAPRKLQRLLIWESASNGRPRHPNLPYHLRFKRTLSL